MDIKKIKEISERISLLTISLEPDKQEDIERLKELAIELFAELDK